MTTADSASQSSRIACEQGTVTTADGLSLATRCWVPLNARGTVTLVHGLAEHSGRYEPLAQALATRGWAVFAADLRAHGLSQDPPGAGRVHVDHFEDYFLDLDAISGIARAQFEALPHFLLGHSMGGLITLRYVLHKPEGLSGAIVSSPALGIHPDSLPPGPLRALTGLLSRLAPRFRVDGGLDSNAVSRDPDVVRDYVNDPLVTTKVSVRWYSEFVQAIERAHQAAPSLRIPLLLMQSGADRLVDPGGPRKWLNQAPEGQVEFHVWEGLYHEMFNEPEKQQVRSMVLDWLERQPGNR